MAFFFFINLIIQKSIGSAYRGNGSSLKLTIQAPGNRETQLNIIVENMGRLNYGGNLFDTKVYPLLIILFRNNH